MSGAAMLQSVWPWQRSGSTDRYVFRSTDGGATWTYVTTGSVSAFVTASRWVWLSNSGEAIETTDAGATWHKYITNYAEAAPIAADFVFGDSLVGYATVRGGISRTVDGGLHWTRIESPGTGIKPTG